MKTFETQNNRGFSLAEILVALGFLGLIIVFFVNSVGGFRDINTLNIEKTEAANIAKEGLEVVRHLRDQDFDNLIDGSYGIRVNNSDEWEFDGTSDLVNNFERVINITSVDATTKLIEANVNWPAEDPSRSLTLIEYLTNWQEIYVPPSADWASTTVASSIDFSGSGNKVVVVGDYAYVVRDSTGTNFYVIDISNPNSPSVNDSTSLPGSLTNIYVSGNYAYITSTDNSEFWVVDISNPNDLSNQYSLDFARGANANGVFVSGSYAYVTRSRDAKKNSFEFNVVDISDPTNPIFEGGLDINTNAFEVYVIGDYAYINVWDNNGEIGIVDVGDKVNPVLAAVYDIPGSSRGQTLTGNTSTIFHGGSNGNFSYIQIQDPVTLNELSNKDVGSVINDIALGGIGNIYAFLVTDTNLAKFIVMDLSNPNFVTEYETNELIADNLNGVAYDPNLDIAVVVGDRVDGEFQIIEPN